MGLTTDQVSQLNKGQSAKYANTAATQANSEPTAVDLAMATLRSDQFSSSINTVDSNLAAVNQLLNKETLTDEEKQQLQTQKTSLIAQKEQLLQKQAELKVQMDALQGEIESYRALAASQQSEINGISGQKSSLENSVKNENELLKNKQESSENIDNSINAIKANLSNTTDDLQSSMSAIAQQSDEQLSQQRAAISNATAEAMAMYSAGQLKADEIPSFIAGKIGGGSTGDVTGLEMVDAKNSKIKALCTQLAGFLVEKCQINVEMQAATAKINMTSPLISSLDSQIKEKTSKLNSHKGVMSGKNSEYESLNTQYESYATQIFSIDTIAGAIDAKVNASPAATAPQNTNTGGAPSILVSTTEAGAAADPSVSFVPTLNFDNIVPPASLKDATAEIDKKYNEMLNTKVQSKEVDDVKATMTGTDGMVLTLRNKLSENAHNLIQERLAATQRK